MNIGQRDAFYAKNSGLSVAQVRRYRTSPVKTWTCERDRRIAATIRGAERLADDEDLSWNDWVTHVRRLLTVIHEFLKGVLETIAEFAERLASVWERIVATVVNLVSSGTLSALTSVLQLGA